MSFRAPAGLTGMSATQHQNRWAALVVLTIGVLMIVLDATIVNVALPDIQRDLGFTQSVLACVVNAYLIAFGGLLLLAGRLGDLISRRGVFLTGLVVFSLASLAAGLADSQAALIAARFVQGAGGALSSAVVLGMIVTMFPEPHEQAKAIGVYAFVASAGGSIGLVAGGVLTDLLSWHWIFFVNVPIGVATALVAPRFVERDEGLGLSGGADVPGAALVTSALMLGVYTIVKPAADYGWVDPHTLVVAAVALALLAAFVVRETRVENPLVPLRIFSSRTLTGANLVQILSVAGMFGSFFLGSLYLQRVLGYSPLEIGLAFLPLTLVMGVLSVRFSEPLITRFGPRRIILAGLAVLTGGLALFARVPVDGNYLTDVLPTEILLGAGAGLTFPALMGLAMSSTGPSDAGLASGLINTTAQVGGALGLAVLATLSTTHSEHLAASGSSSLAALAAGYRLAFVIAAALAAAALVVAARMLDAPAPSTAATPSFDCGGAVPEAA